MKKAMLAVSVLILAMGIAAAGTQAAAAAGKTHEVTTEVVSVDAAAKTITIKDETGAPKTVPLLGNAEEMLKNVKPGAKVTLTCQDNEAGEHQGVTKIKPAPATASK